MEVQKLIEYKPDRVCIKWKNGNRILVNATGDIINSDNFSGDSFQYIYVPVAQEITKIKHDFIKKEAIVSFVQEILETQERLEKRRKTVSWLFKNYNVLKN